MRQLISQYLETDIQFYRNLFKVAAPVILQSLITTGLNLVDTIMLGQLTENILSASSQANQFIALFIFSMMGISMGASVLCSRFWGAKDKISLKKTITIALRFGLVLAGIFTFINIVFPRQIMSIYINDPIVIEHGRIYLLWSSGTYLLIAITLITTNVMRSVGINKVSLIASIMAFFTNIIANYILIFGNMGAPKMGIAGAAIGTLIARIIETSIIVISFYVRDKRVSYRLRDFFTKSNDMLVEFFSVSFPVMISDSLLGVGESVLAIIMGGIGTSFISANAITNVVQRVSTTFVSGLAFAGCFVIGHTLGEGRISAARKQGNTFLALGLITGLLAAITIYALTSFTITAYNITEQTKEIAYQLSYAVSFIIIFRATNSVLTKGVLRGGGDTRFLLVADISTMWMLAIPLGVLAVFVWRLPAFWIYVCLHADQIIKSIWCVIRMRSDKWIKKVKGVETQTINLLEKQL